MFWCYTRQKGVKAFGGSQLRKEARERILASIDDVSKKLGYSSFDECVQHTSGVWDDIGKKLRSFNTRTKADRLLSEQPEPGAEELQQLLADLPKLIILFALLFRNSQRRKFLIRREGAQRLCRRTSIRKSAKKSDRCLHRR
jgi:hypothetical protein